MSNSTAAYSKLHNNCFVSWMQWKASSLMYPWLIGSFGSHITRHPHLGDPAPLVFLGGSVVHDVGRDVGVTLLDQAKSSWDIDDNDDGHCLESAVSISFSCGLDDVGHVLVKLQLLNPLLWNQSAKIGRLWYMEGQGSVGRLLARLLLCLTRFRTCALHLAIQHQTFHSDLMGNTRSCTACHRCISYSFIQFIWMGR